MTSARVHLALLIALAAAPAQNVSFRYFYDSNHRLTGVLDSSGNFVQYVYDPAGNPAQINRSVIAANSLAILNIVPQRGSVGQSITIFGQNFGATAGANIVKFNGVQATVTSALAGQLVATVPSGAATGPISVTVGAAIAQSSVFTVVRSLVSIAVTPPSPSVQVGTPQQFNATGTYSDSSTADLTASANWASSAPAVATVSMGLATTLSAGSTTVSASVSGISGSTLLTVSPNLVSLAIIPSDPAVTVGDTLQLSAIGTYSDSSTQNFTTQVTWSSSHPNFATVSNAAGSQGLLTGVAAGSSTITAALGGTITGQTLATVTLPTPLQTPRFLYVSDLSNGITIYSVNASSGQLRTIGAIPPGRLNATPPVVVGNYLYIPDVEQGQRGIIGYSINSANGSLTALPGSPFPVNASVSQPLASLNPLVVTPSGAYAFVILPNSTFAPPLVVTMSIDSTTGTMSYVSSTPVGEQETNADSFAMDPRGHFLYVADDFLQVLFVFSINQSTGATAQVTGSPFSFPSVGAVQQIAASPASPFVYLYDVTNSQLVGLSVDGVSGVPTPLASGPTAVGPVNNSVMPAMRFDPSGQHLYVGETNGFEGFAVSDTGALTSVPASPFSIANGNDFQVAIDPSNQFLYAGYYDSNVSSGSLATYQLGPGGTLTLLSTQTGPSTDQDGGMGFYGGSNALSYTPAYAYTANSKGNDLSLFSVNDTTGALNSLLSSPLTGFATPIAVASDPLGQFVFSLDQNGLEMFTESPSGGGLTPASGSPYTAGTTPVAVAVDPLDRFVFVANVGSNNVSVFQLDAAGASLTAVPGSPFPADAMPSALAVDPAGQVLLVTDLGSGKVSAYDILFTGTLRSNAGPFAAGTSPLSVAIDASGHYAYVVNQGSNNISIFSIIPNVIFTFGSGASLQSIATQGLPAGSSLPRAVAIDPTGRFLYVAGGPTGVAGTVSAYTIDPATGNLTLIAGAPFAAGQAPASAFVDPSGMFLYVTNAGSGNVSVYSIDPHTGVLSPIPAPTFPTGTNPLSITVSPRIQ